MSKVIIGWCVVLFAIGCSKTTTHEVTKACFSVYDGVSGKTDQYCYPNFADCDSDSLGAEKSWRIIDKTLTVDGQPSAHLITTCSWK